ncbi:MAG: hypothetical protein A2918_01670 [Candidatus Yanofskybacteria bacterium RIFCSPLOWO2_01_FULL_42_49]|uniref:Uncharacterized protein n=1 Tax=Candidatus Yanofskybacteria bacterium RIFCSPLOWO2_01_FULL_42_49 TaxID=1802694 RepID=A0A1F8GF94_9BACT|nr:MAG: hypothetical protein A2918_01670 [Candidatus Yanofskybacteria bacterium RIFCSPLOWO2_01_FULL_42_49]
MPFLSDIKKQPQHTREIMFGLSVFITILLIGMVWFRSFQQNLYVLLNPEEEVDKILAVENAPVPSLFGFIWQTAGDVKGLVFELFNGKEMSGIELKGFQDSARENKVYTLPLSEYK